MKAIRRTIRIDDPNRVVLLDLPFCKGQEVEIIFLSRADSQEKAEEVRALFRRTQALPKAVSLTEEEIESEVDACRSGQ